MTAPTFTGSHIDVRLEEEPLTLVVNWSRDSFQDEEDPYPLAYQYALGNYVFIFNCVYSTAGNFHNSDMFMWKENSTDYKKIFGTRKI